MESLPRSFKDWLFAGVLFTLAYGLVYGLMAIPQ